jgi:hypothetical protein
LQPTHARIGKYCKWDKKEPTGYEVGDHGMLKPTHLQTRRPSKNLDKKGDRPFLVEKIITLMAIPVTFARSSRIHYQFHSNLFDPYGMSSW